MKNPLLRRFLPVLLLALSLAVNLWQFLNQSDQNNTPEQKRRPAIAANNFHKLEQKTKAEASSKALAEKSVEPEQPYKRDSYFTVPTPGAPPQRSVSEHPEDWMPPLPAERVKPEALQALLEQEPPTDAVIEVSARITDKNGEVKDFGTTQTTPGGSMVLQMLKEFPFPAKFDPPQLNSPADGASSFPVIPTVPASFNFKNTGWEIEVTPSFKGGFIMLEGNTKYSAFAGFETAAGIPFRPIESENGVRLTDNRTLLPKFTTYEMPFIDAVQFGETLQMPVHSPDGEAVLEISVRRLP